MNPAAAALAPSSQAKSVAPTGGTSAEAADSTAVSALFPAARVVLAAVHDRKNLTLAKIVARCRPYSAHTIADALRRLVARDVVVATGETRARRYHDPALAPVTTTADADAPKACRQCGATFTRRYGREGRSAYERRVYCSRACRDAAQSNRMVEWRKQAEYVQRWPVVTPMASELRRLLEYHKPFRDVTALVLAREEKRGVRPVMIRSVAL